MGKEYVEGVSGRWTLLSQLHNVGQLERQITVNIFAIDSRKELEIGIGRLLKSKKVIGERQAMVS